MASGLHVFQSNWILQPVTLPYLPKLLNRSLHIAFIIHSEGHGGCQTLGGLAVVWGFLAVGMDLDMEEPRPSYPIEEVLESGSLILLSYSGADAFLRSSHTGWLVCPFIWSLDIKSWRNCSFFTSCRAPL